MRAAGQLAAQALQYAGQIVRPGLTTEELDAAVHQFIVDHNAYPSPLNYYGFPKSICTSVNEVVCHGIPDSRWGNTLGAGGSHVLELADGQPGCATAQFSG